MNARIFKKATHLLGCLFQICITEGMYFYFDTFCLKMIVWKFRTVILNALYFIIEKEYCFTGNDPFLLKQNNISKYRCVNDLIENLNCVMHTVLVDITFMVTA